MVPKGWVKKQIGDIALIQVGRDLKEDNYSEFHLILNIYVITKYAGFYFIQSSEVAKCLVSVLEN